MSKAIWPESAVWEVCHATYDICCGLGMQITDQRFSSNAVIEQVMVVVSEHEILSLCYVQMTFLRSFPDGISSFLLS